MFRKHKMKKLILVIAMCLPLMASATIVFPTCADGYNLVEPCPQIFETTDTDLTQEQALEIATQTIALVWDRSIPEDFDDVSAWLASCEHVSAQQYESDGSWDVTYIFDDLMREIRVVILRDGRVSNITVYPCGLDICLV